MKWFKKRRIEKGYLLLLTAISIFLLVGYFSYAMFTVKSEQKEAIRIITGTLEGELKVDGNLIDQLVVAQGETKEFTVTLKNINDRTARYLLYYIGTLPEGLEVGYTSDGSVPPEENGRNITSGITETYIIKVKNTTGSSQTVQLQLDSGLEHIDLTLPENGHLFEEIRINLNMEEFIKEYVNKENQNYDDESKNKMFIYHHKKGSQQEDYNEEELTDYRYIGENPNNYVTFNDEEAGWRIIGIFTVEDENGNKEKRIKLIKTKHIGWIPYTNDGSNNNDWALSYLNKMINPGNQETVFSIQDKDLKKFKNTKWYLGGYDNTNIDLGTPEDWYTMERGTKVYSGNSISCIEKVGLPYPSDYGFATSGGEKNNKESCLNSMIIDWQNLEDCYQNNWLLLSGQYWTITPTAGNYSHAFIVGNKGNVYSDKTSYPMMIHPTIYLSSDVQISCGSGTEKNPFILY